MKPIGSGRSAVIRSALGIVLLAAGIPPGPPASPAAGAAMVHPPVFDRVEELRLDNGMLFLLLPRHEVPTVSGRIRFRVGNVDNQVGQTGMAHMFEHMAFKGTDKIGTRDWRAELAVQDSVDRVGTALARETARHARADTARISMLHAQLERLTERQIALTVPMEFPRLYDRYVSDFNAFTSVDFTEYHADLTANALEVWMLMESERIQHPSFREFYRERDVVKEERRQSTEDDPMGMAWELLYALAFTAHPYRTPTIGYMSDLETLTQGQAEAFQRTYYVPGNAVGVLVGDFDPKEAKQMIRDYFGDIPPGPAPPEVVTEEPPQRGARRGVIRMGTERGCLICFPGFAPDDRRAAVARLLAAVLNRDNTSRLDHRLDVREKAVRRIRVSADGSFHRYPGVFEIEAIPLEGFTNELIEAMIWDELGRVVSEPLTQSKLDEIRAANRKNYYYALETNAQLSAELIDHQTIYGDWRHSYERFATSDAVTPEEVTDLARDLFQRDRATVVYLEPKEAPAGEPEGGAR
jgi:predicted Zn-dependent peptidase